MSNTRHLQTIPPALIRKWWWRKKLTQKDQFNFAPLFFECMLRHKQVDTLFYYLENAASEKLQVIAKIAPFLIWFRSIYREFKGSKSWIELITKDREDGRNQGVYLSYLHVEELKTVDGVPDLRGGKWYNNTPSVDYYHSGARLPIPHAPAYINLNSPDTILRKDFMRFVKKAREEAIRQGFMKRGQLKALSKEYHPEKTANIEPKLKLLEVWDCESHSPRISPQGLFAWRKKAGYTQANDKGTIESDIARAKQLIEVNVWASITANIANVVPEIPQQKGVQEIRSAFGIETKKENCL